MEQPKPSRQKGRSPAGRRAYDTAQELARRERAAIPKSGHKPKPVTLPAFKMPELSDTINGKPRSEA